MSGRRPRAWRLRESAQHCPSSTREASSLFINKPREAMGRVQGHAASRDRRPPGSGPAPSCPALTDALSHPGPNSAPRRGPGSDLHVICEMGSQAPPCRATVKPGGPAKVTRSLPQKPRETQRNPGPRPGHRPLRELLESAHCIPGPARPATPSPPPAPPPAGTAVPVTPPRSRPLGGAAGSAASVLFSLTAFIKMHPKALALQSGANLLRVLDKAQEY